VAHPETPPTVEAVRTNRKHLGDMVIETPVVRWQGPGIARLTSPETEVFLKLELLQNTGSFKVRGALTVALNQPPEVLERGLTAVSSGNHAIAVSYVAQTLGVSAKVIMLSTANAMCRAECERYGAETIYMDDGAEAFELAGRFVEEEGRYFVHPYEGPFTTLGAASVGLEIHEQIRDLDAVVIAIGGGGLCSGVGPTLKQLSPRTRIFAVEPEGAATMYRSFRTGKPETLDRVETIASSLAPPRTEPYSLGMCRQSVDDLVLISDQQIRDAMALLYREMKLVVEPGGAAATAALCGPLRERLLDRRVAVMVCGSNIDVASFAELTSLASDPP
jgi:threonine dehydratase